MKTDEGKTVPIWLTHHPLSPPCISPNPAFHELSARNDFLAIAHRELAVWQVGC